MKNLRNLWKYSIIAGFAMFLIAGCEKDDLDKIDPSLVTDIDGNVYHTVTIGTQVWMTENLKAKRFSNGDPIATTDPVNLDIRDEIDPVYQWVYGGDENNLADYGLLYTWQVVDDSRNVCPTGWHVPSHDEWLILEDSLGGSSIAGGKIKEAGYDHWISPNTEATDSSGFHALPGGYRAQAGGNTLGGGIASMGRYAFYWTSTEISSQYAYSIRLVYNSGGMFDHTTERDDAVSIRCIKD